MVQLEYSVILPREFDYQINQITAKGIFGDNNRYLNLSDVRYYLQGEGWKETSNMRIYGPAIVIEEEIIEEEPQPEEEDEEEEEEEPEPEPEVPTLEIIKEEL